MNWEMIGAIGQIVAALGVIASLIYLAVQIKHQNKESRRAAVNILTAQWGDFMRSTTESSEFSAIYLRGIRSFDDLDAVARLRFGTHLGFFFRTSEGLYLQFVDGTLDPRLWACIERTIADLAPYPGVQAWWATRKHRHIDEFCIVVDRIIVTEVKPKAYDNYL